MSPQFEVERCENCFWWLRGAVREIGTCTRFRPSVVRTTIAPDRCHEHSFDSPYDKARNMKTEAADPLLHSLSRS